MGFLLFIPQILGAIEAGITSWSKIKKAVSDGKLAVVGNEGQLLTSEADLRAAIGETRAAALDAGDEAAARIERRHEGDPTG